MGHLNSLWDMFDTNHRNWTVVNTNEQWPVWCNTSADQVYFSTYTSPLLLSFFLFPLFVFVWLALLRFFLLDGEEGKNNNQNAADWSAKIVSHPNILRYQGRKQNINCHCHMVTINVHKGLYGCIRNLLITWSQGNRYGWPIKLEVPKNRARTKTNEIWPTANHMSSMFWPYDSDGFSQKKQ